MARSKTDLKKLLIIATLLVVFVLLTGSIAFLALRKPNAFANLSAFPIDSYMEGKGLLSQEDYKMEGRVDNVILRSASGEKLLVAIQPDGSDLRLPVVLEKNGGKGPVQREQHLVLRVNLGASSQIQCTRFETR